MVGRVQIWAGNAQLEESKRYTGALSLLNAESADGRSELIILEAEPRVTATAELVEGYLCGALGRPPRLLDVLKIHAKNDTAAYVVRGMDLAAGLYYLEWPD